MLQLALKHFSSSGRKGAGPAAMVLAPLLARPSAISLPTIFACDGTHRRFMGLLLDIRSSWLTHSVTSFVVSLGARSVMCYLNRAVQDSCHFCLEYAGCVANKTPVGCLVSQIVVAVATAIWGD